MINQFYKNTSLCVLFSASILLPGCTDDNTPKTDKQTVHKGQNFIELMAAGEEADAFGYLVDSPVKGIRYKSGKHYGITDETGRYGYQHDEAVEFFIGDIAIGSAITPLALLTPYELADGDARKALNIARFLQTLDNDNNADSGLEIDEVSHTLAEGLSIDFSSEAWRDPVFPDLDFFNNTLPEGRSELNLMVLELTSATQAGARYLKSNSEAYAHLAETLNQHIDSLETEAEGLAHESRCNAHEDCKLMQLSTRYTSYCPPPGPTLVYSTLSAEESELQRIANQRDYLISVNSDLEHQAGQNDLSTGLCLSVSAPSIPTCNEARICEIRTTPPSIVAE
jgi:hypothetical protein